MELTKEEEQALSGEFGPSLASAYRILAAIGEATGAKRLVPVEWAHVSGVNYNTIGDAGVQFLEDFSQESKALVRTTINPMGYDLDHPEGISDRFRAEQERIALSYKRLGVVPSFTCTPYEVFDLPARGSQVSFAESNAAVFANSVLGLRTNKESALSALASSVTGKTPLSELRLEDFRKPSLSIKADFEFAGALDYGLMGYFAGKSAKEGDACVSLSDITKPAPAETKALCAGIGTSGSCGMFVLGNDQGDASEGGNRTVATFDKRERSKLMDELCTSEKGDVIALGSPQLGLAELEALAAGVAGKKFDRRCMVFCSRSVHAQAARIGLAGRIESSGAEFRCDSCTCLTPYVTKETVDSVVTSSVKAAYYFNHSNKVGVSLKDLPEIIAEYTE